MSTISTIATWIVVPVMVLMIIAILWKTIKDTMGWGGPKLPRYEPPRKKEQDSKQTDGGKNDKWI